MKSYEILPKMWDEQRQDYVFVGYSDCVETYAIATSYAKRMSKQYDRVDIELTQINRSDFASKEEYEDEIMYNRASHHLWTESYECGKQVPVLSIKGVDVWRWNMQGYPIDLKPRKK